MKDIILPLQINLVDNQSKLVSLQAAAGAATADNKKCPLLSGY
jgi:hypothetical protein